MRSAGLVLGFNCNDGTGAMPTLPHAWACGDPKTCPRKQKRGHGTHQITCSRVLTLLLTSVMIFCSAQTASGQDSATVSVGNVTAQPGQLVDVPVTLANAAGLGAMDLHLRYDPQAIQFDSLKAADGPANLVANGPVRGQVKVALLCGAGLATPDFSFALRFRVLAPAGEATKIQVLRATAFNAETALKMSLSPQDGQVQIVSADVTAPPGPLTTPAPPATRPATQTPPRTTGGTTLRTGPRTPGHSPAGSPKPTPPATPTVSTRPIGTPWSLDIDSLLNLAIATSSGLLVIVLLVALFWALRPKPDQPAAGAPRPTGRPVEDGPIPLAEVDPTVATRRVIAAMANGSRPAPPAPAARQAGLDPTDSPSPADLQAADPLRCARCRRPVPPGARFCPQCGSPIGQGSA